MCARDMWYLGVYMCARVHVVSRCVHVCSCTCGVYLCTCVLVYVWCLGVYMCACVCVVSIILIPYFFEQPYLFFTFSKCIKYVRYLL